MGIFRNARPRISVEGLVAEYNEALDLFDVPRVSFMMALMTGKTKIRYRTIRGMKDGVERRRKIVASLIEEGVLMQHKADHLKLTLGFNDKLESYYRGE